MSWSREFHYTTVPGVNSLSVCSDPASCEFSLWSSSWRVYCCKYEDARSWFVCILLHSTLNSVILNSELQDWILCVLIPAEQFPTAHVLCIVDLWSCGLAGFPVPWVPQALQSDPSGVHWGWCRWGIWQTLLPWLEGEVFSWPAISGAWGHHRAV